ncbi:MAG: ribosome-associated protein [Oleiphilaceae bacterium]|jgi:ribosome-associated protein
MQTLELKSLVIESLEDLKADNICVIDVKDKTSVTDFMVVASGTSTRHVRSLAENLVTEVKSKGVKTLGVEGADVSDWVLVDLGEVVVHVMLPSARTFYDLEGFWRDGPDPSQTVVEH